jgi:hypothetical protein
MEFESNFEMKRRERQSIATKKMEWALFRRKNFHAKTCNAVGYGTFEQSSQPIGKTQSIGEIFLIINLLYR